MPARSFPPALAHGELIELLPDVFFVTGTIAMPGRLPVRFSRNMTVVREGERLVIVNSVRLGDEGMRKLDALGKVTDVLRIAGFHGMDDPFYADRYGAKVWALAGQRYTSGFDIDKPKTYFTPDIEIAAATTLPLADARLHVFGSRPPEGLLVLGREGGIVVAGDCLQNWGKADAYFSTIGTLMMKMMGFLRPYNVGPGWLKQAKPPLDELRGVLELGFEHVLPAHGAAVIGDAKARFRPRIEAVTGG